ncbi:MAG: cache domain-containing protein, partial [Treponema sp.]|nr:cache domain-containing protein [Treponema sp.]
MKIGKKLIIMIITLTLVGIGILLGTIVTISRAQITSLIDGELKNLGKNEASVIKAWLDDNLSMVRTLAVSMEAYEQIELSQRRFFYNLLLKAQAENNSDIASIWTCWEPNALDGLDAQYVNTEGTDATGRFTSYWVRTNGNISLEALEDYEDPTTGGYYLIPRRTGKETIVEPYFYTIDGVSTLITSLVVPIKKNGVVVGAVGIDIPLSKIQASVEAIHPYEGSIAAVFSNGGIVAGHFDPSRLGKSMTVTEVEIVGDRMTDYTNAIKTGALYSFSSTINTGGANTGFTILSIPISIGETDTPWAVALGAPQTIVNA